MTARTSLLSLPAAPLGRILARRRTAPPQDAAAAPRHVRLTKRMFGDERSGELALMGLDTVFAAVRILTNTVAASTWEPVAIDPETGNRTPTDRGVWQLLNRRPNEETTGVLAKRYWLRGSVLGHGGLIEIERNRVGRPVALWPIENHRWVRERQAGRVVFRVSNPTGPDTILPDEDALYLPPESLDAESPLPIYQLGRAVFGAASAHQRFQNAYYEHAGVLSGVLETDDNIEPEDVAEILEGFMDAYQGGGNAFGVALLTAGMKWKSLTPDLAEADLDKMARAQDLRIARFFGVQPHLLGILDNATYSNIAEQGIDFERYGVMGLCEAAAQECAAKLFDGDPFYDVRVQTEWMTEGNAKDRAEADAKEYLSGLASADDINRRRRRNTIGGPEGEARVLQQGFAPLSSVVRGETVRRDGAASREDGTPREAPAPDRAGRG